MSLKECNSNFEIIPIGIFLKLRTHHLIQTQVIKKLLLLFTFRPGLRSDFLSTILKTGLYKWLNAKILTLAKIFNGIFLVEGLRLT